MKVQENPWFFSLVNIKIVLEHIIIIFQMLDNFEFCDKLDNFEIERICVFNDYSEKKNIFFVTREGELFSFGSNYCGVCDLGHNNEVNCPEKIVQLCQQNIKDFKNGLTFVLGLSQKGELWSWGENDRGQLGLKFVSESNEYMIPHNIRFFNNKQIEQVSCGYRHALVLLSNGDIYMVGVTSLIYLKTLNVVR